MNYEVELEGYYEVSIEISSSVPTGEMEEVLNPKYRRWKFWAPKTIVRKKYETSVSHGKTIAIYLRPGDVIHAKRKIIRLG